MSCKLGLYCFVFIVFAALPGYSQEIEELPPGTGWGQHYRLTGSLSFNDNSHVVGKTDGLTSTFGSSALYEGGYRSFRHQWRYRLSIRESLTKTPEIASLIKTEDQLLVQTEYLYAFTQEPDFGAYASAGVETPIFPSHDVRSEATDYLIHYIDGTTDSRNTDQVRLTDPFRPLTLRESLGLYFFPYEYPYFHLEFRSGPEARQILANNQLVVADDDTTPNVIELQELENVYVLGWLGSIRTYGNLYGDSLSYEAFTDVTIPFLLNETRESDRSKWKLYHLNSGAKLASKLTGWLQFEYVLQVRREPLILDEFQVSHLIQLNLLIERFFGTYRPIES